MTGWIAFIAFVTFLIALGKLLIQSTIDIGNTLTVVTSIALILFIIGTIYLPSNALLLISILFLAGVFIKQRML